MATNRYVGARYVPVFDEDWDNTKAYDPLTIVSYQGDSYTSRGYVPVGTAITNTTYWAKTGNFNQQVAHVSDRVDRVEDDVRDLQNEDTRMQGEIDDLESDVTALKTFKQQLPSRFMVVTKTVEIGSINAGALKSGESANIVVTGLTPIGVVGFETGDVFIVSECFLTGSGNNVKVSARAYNTDSNPANCEVVAYVLYFNNEGY